MATQTVRADWVEDELFLLRDRFDFPIVMTQPSGISGADLLPLSLIGCSIWDIMGILKKQRQHVTGAQVFADSEREDEPPWRFKRIRIRYRFTGHNLEAGKIEHAIALSEAKYCSIYATLRNCVEITSEVEVVAA